MDASISRRAFVAGGSAALLMLAGCSSTNVDDGSAPMPTKGTADISHAGFGDQIDLGSVVITIDGVERDVSEESRYIEQGLIEGGSNLLILTGLCENITYKEFSDDTVCLNDFMHLEDADGVTLKPMDSMYGYGQYTSASGSYFSCPIGEKARFAMAYDVPGGTDSVTVIVGENEIPSDIGNSDEASAASSTYTYQGVTVTASGEWTYSESADSATLMSSGGMVMIMKPSECQNDIEPEMARTVIDSALSSDGITATSDYIDTNINGTPTIYKTYTNDNIDTPNTGQIRAMMTHRLVYGIFTINYGSGNSADALADTIQYVGM